MPRDRWETEETDAIERGFLAILLSEFDAPPAAAARVLSNVQGRFRTKKDLQYAEVLSKFCTFLWERRAQINELIVGRWRGQSAEVAGLSRVAINFHLDMVRRVRAREDAGLADIIDRATMATDDRDHVLEELRIVAAARGLDPHSVRSNLCKHKKGLLRTMKPVLVQVSSTTTATLADLVSVYKTHMHRRTNDVELLKGRAGMSSATTEQLQGVDLYQYVGPLQLLCRRYCFKTIRLLSDYADLRFQVVS
jgi:hypothetical protein